MKCARNFYTFAACEKIVAMYDVFISYSRKDYYDEKKKCVIEGNVVSKIRKLLDDNGITYWFDKDGIYSGDEFLDVIAKAIRESKIFLFISTANSNASDWTKKEIATANFLKKKIIPFRIDESEYADSVLLILSGLDHAELFKDGDRAFDVMLASVKENLKEIKEKETKEEIKRHRIGRINNLKNDIETYKRQLKEYDDKIRLDLALVKIDEKSYNEIVKKINDAEDELFYLKDDVSREHEKLEDYNSEEDKLKKKIEELEKQKEQHLNEEDRLKKRINELEREKEENLNKIHSLKKEIEEPEKQKQEGNAEKKYDVFISSKSEDYSQAELLSDFLRRNGLHPFLASESLRRVGNTAYLDEIDKALDESQHLIVFCTKPEYAESEFVKEEWQSFRNEKLSGRKSGNILTVVADGIQIGQLPYGLRRYEVILLSNYEKVLLSYLTINNEAERKEAERKAEKPKFQDKTIKYKDIPIEMVAVNGGPFEMGASSGDSDADDDEKPAHSVTLGDYYIGKYEVTQELWEAVMGSKPSFNGGWTNEYGVGKNYPAYRVRWYEAVEFCNRLSEETGRRPYYSIDKERKDPNSESEKDDLKWTVRVNPGADGFRLPTEAEWEYAARGGNRSRGYKYSGSNSIGGVAWYKDNSGDKTHVVGTKSPNELGIYDMSGNVWEWCQDWYGRYGSGSQTNPQGPSSGSDRVIRGGSWGYYASHCRVSRRHNSNPGGWGSYDGLRLALVL